MRAPSFKCAFLLLGTFVVSIVLYGTFSDWGRSVQPLEDSAEPDFQPTWNISFATEDEDLVEAACSLRKAVRNNPLVNKIFSFSVSVFLSAGSFSKPAWEQLKNQRPPYGWKSVPADVVKSSVSQLSSSHLFERGSPDRCVRCAVVGNGGILRGSRQGKNIDSHDFVFRMNGAMISGFEKDVGKKISFYGFSTNTMKHALIWYRGDGFTRIPQSPDIKYIFIPADIRDYVMLAAAIRGRAIRSGKDIGDRPSRYFGHKPAEYFKMLHPAFISYVTRNFLASSRLDDIRSRDLYMPSTGALMLLTAIHTCDQVSAYGFITRNYAAFSDHYYDSVRRPLRFYANHDLQMEAQLWETLHRQRIIKLYQRRTRS
ncbi:alpha-N-acetylgalactosaminide alpha-2,6-sialyltransferase 2 [Mugil cephalus]|uniref:alpha-N-acetylgalactosaminide alpha-2,6-sialyltransferase 2 n=1 Tax=Mugil cephalus TaxID=48193 RepID=UPI001FB7D569|nr:alpha-N-acetylgalactosaminide alpha-2,6-sialyltransferase 2 [Mugil cephalus]